MIRKFFSGGEAKFHALCWVWLEIMSVVFSDTFEVRAVNPDKKIFDRVDRLDAIADTYGCELIIDINCDLWKVRQGDKIEMKLASSLTGGADDGTFRQSNEASLLDTVTLNQLSPLCLSSGPGYRATYFPLR